MTVLVWNISTVEDGLECCEKVYNKVKMITFNFDLNCYEIILENGRCQLVNKEKYYIEVI